MPIDNHWCRAYSWYSTAKLPKSSMTTLMNCSRLSRCRNDWAFELFKSRRRILDWSEPKLQWTPPPIKTRFLHSDLLFLKNMSFGPHKEIPSCITEPPRQLSGWFSWPRWRKKISRSSRMDYCSTIAFL